MEDSGLFPRYDYVAAPARNQVEQVYDAVEELYAVPMNLNTKSLENIASQDPQETEYHVPGQVNILCLFILKFF